MTLFLQSWCYQANNCLGSYLLLMKMYAIKQMCKILNKKAKFTFWCNLDFRFLQFRLYCALYWSRAPYICENALGRQMKHFLEYHRKHNTKKWHWKSWNKMEKPFLMFRQAKTHPLNCWVMTSLQATANNLPFDRCFLLHVASFPFRLQYWAMVYSKNATKTNVSQPNIQMSIALERFNSRLSSCFALVATIS